MTIEGRGIEVQAAAANLCERGLVCADFTLGHHLCATSSTDVCHRY